MSDFQMTVPNQSVDDFKKQKRLASTAILRRIKLMQGISREVTAGTAGTREFLLGDDKNNLGTKFLAVVGPYRPHAIQFDEGKMASESFNIQESEYEVIASKAAKWQKGCSAGPEFLLWLPEVEQFGLLHFVRGALENGDEAFRQQNKLVTITSELAGNPNKRQWPVACVSATPVHLDPASVAIPDRAAWEHALKQFLAPTLERAAEETDSRPR